VKANNKEKKIVAYGGNIIEPTSTSTSAMNGACHCSDRRLSRRETTQFVLHWLIDSAVAKSANLQRLITHLPNDANFILIASLSQMAMSERS
jgi:hypothetical protein